MASGTSAVVRAAEGAALDGTVAPIPASYTQTRPVLTLTMQLASAEDSMIIMVTIHYPMSVDIMSEYSAHLGSQSLF